MTIHFYLERKKLKSKELTIWCVVRGLARGKSIQLNTRQKIERCFWDSVKERAIDRGKNKYAGAKELNNFLDSYVEEIKKAERIFITNNHSADYESIKLAIKEAVGSNKGLSHSFFEALDLFIEIRTKELSPSTIQKFRTLKKHLTGYESRYRTEITFAKVDLLFYDKFFNYLLDNKLKNNSAYKQIGHLKTYLQWAFDRGISRYEYFRKFKIKEDKVDIVTLTEQEVKKLYELDLSNIPHLDRVRDLFIFGCNTGVRYIDLVNITREDIKNNHWYLRVKKTRDVIEIPLTETAQLILKKYQNSEHPLPRPTNQNYNEYLKVIGKMGEINETIKTVSFRGSEAIIKEYPKYDFITAHTSRRTFITQSLWKGMKQHVVMAITGHTTDRSFKKYVNISSRDKQEEMNKIWNQNKTESDGKTEENK